MIGVFMEFLALTGLLGCSDPSMGWMAFLDVNYDSGTGNGEKDEQSPVSRSFHDLVVFIFPFVQWAWNGTGQMRGLGDLVILMISTSFNSWCIMSTFKSCQFVRSVVLHSFVHGQFC